MMPEEECVGVMAPGGQCTWACVIWAHGDMSKRDVWPHSS